MHIWRVIKLLMMNNVVSDIIRLLIFFSVVYGSLMPLMNNEIELLIREKWKFLIFVTSIYSQEGMGYDFLVATTKVVNGNTILRPIITNSKEVMI